MIGFAPPASAQVDQNLTGDVNCDNVVDIVDALVIAQFTVSARSAVAQCPLGNPRTDIVAANGDMDRSGSTDIVDALLVARCSVAVTNLGCPRQVVDLPAAFTTTEVSVGTDGFVPITVGQKTYTIAHRGNEIACVDLSTSLPCWSPRPLASQSATTMQVHNATAVGNDIYFLMWIGSTNDLPTGDGALRVGCWDTQQDRLCTGRVDLPNVGHGTMSATGNAVWVFAADRKVYCFAPGTLAPCPTYEDGRNTSLGGEPGWGSWNEASAWNGDILTMGRRIYVTLANRGQVWLHCWDAAVAEACVAFNPVNVNNTRLESNDDDLNGRLFLDRAPDGEPIAVCSQGSSVRVDCYHPITGADAPASESALSSTLGSLSIQAGGLVGVSTYHEATNRQFFVGTASSSTTACYDFTAAEFCGASTSYATAFGDPEPYGYEDAGDCLYGFGDSGVLFAIAPDLTLGCGAATSVTTEIRPAATGRWGQLVADDAEGYAISIRVTDADGNVLLPVDGGRLELDDRPISLEVLPPQLGVAFLDVRVSGPAGGGSNPQLLIG